MKLQTYRTYDAFNCTSSKGDGKHGNKTHLRKMMRQNYINHSHRGQIRKLTSNFYWLKHSILIIFINSYEREQSEKQAKKWCPIQNRAILPYTRQTNLSAKRKGQGFTYPKDHQMEEKDGGFGLEREVENLGSEMAKERERVCGQVRDEREPNFEGLKPPNENFVKKRRLRENNFMDCLK